MKSLNLVTRFADAANKPGELKTIAIDPAKLAKSYPLGPTSCVLDRLLLDAASRRRAAERANAGNGRD